MNCPPSSSVSSANGPTEARAAAASDVLAASGASTGSFAPCAPGDSSTSSKRIPSGDSVGGGEYECGNGAGHELAGESPLPDRKRRREQPQREDGSDAGIRHDILDGDSTTAAAFSPTSIAATMTVQRVQDMTADEYMRLVSQQAKSLPDVFVSRPTPTMTTGAPVEEQKAGAETRASHRRKTKLSRRTSEPPIDGCAASLWHMLGGGGGDGGGDGQGGPSSSEFVLRAPTSRHLPAHPREWVDQVLHQFSTLRQYLERLHAFKVDAASLGTGVAATLPRNRIPVPAMKDRTGWIRFCVGSDAGALDPSSGLDDGNCPPYGKKAAWTDQLPPGGYSPEVSLLMQLDQVMTRAVLSHLTAFVADHVAAAVGDRKERVFAALLLSSSLAEWLYGLLARLEKPLHRNDASTLFQVLKRLTQARCHWSPIDPGDVEGVASGGASRATLSRLNLLIAVVGIYFEQGGFHAVMTCTDGAEGRQISGTK